MKRNLKLSPASIENWFLRFQAAKTKTLTNGGT